MALQRVRAGLDAESWVITGHDGDKPIYTKQPDHRNRLDAVRRFTELMRLVGDQQAAAPGVPTNPLENLTWEQVQRMYYEEQACKAQTTANLRPNAQPDR